MGAVITYMRRYTLSGILGIYADEDNDGNEGDKKPAKAATPAPAPVKVVTPDIAAPEGAAAVVDTYIYTGRGVKVGHNIYPVQWGRLIMTYTRANQFECDGILQQLRPPFDTRPEDVIDLISAHLANKAQAEQK
jgi:hypothetical protein